MHSIRTVLLSVLALLLLFSLSCSGGSPATPPVNTGQGNGDIGPVDPVGPFPVDPVPIDPIPWPWWDCQRFFDCQGSISFWMDPDGPHTIPMIVFGGIRIRDEDCSANESEVRVRFRYDDWPQWNRNLPGTKTKTNIGTVYEGGLAMHADGIHHGYSIEWTYELLAHWQQVGDPDGNPSIYQPVIDGWYHKHRHDWWMTPSGYVIHKHRHAHTNWHGVEVFQAFEPEPKP